MNFILHNTANGHIFHRYKYLYLHRNIYVAWKVSLKTGEIAAIAWLHSEIYKWIHLFVKVHWVGHNIVLTVTPEKSLLAVFTLAISDADLFYYHKEVGQLIPPAPEFLAKLIILWHMWYWSSFFNLCKKMNKGISQNFKYIYLISKINFSKLTDNLFTLGKQL